MQRPWGNNGLAQGKEERLSDQSTLMRGVTHAVRSVISRGHGRGLRG